MEKEVKKPRIRDIYNHVHTKVVVQGVSCTLPNQSMTVKEIYNRYVVGAPLPPMSVREWNSDPEDSRLVVPDFSKMDLADIADYKLRLAEREEYLREILQEQKRAEDLQSSAESAQSSETP